MYQHVVSKRDSRCTEVEAGRRKISQDTKQVSFIIRATDPWGHFQNDMLLFELLKIVLAAA